MPYISVALTGLKIVLLPSTVGELAADAATLTHVCYLSRLRRFQLLLYISLANQEQDSVAALATQAHARSEQ